MCMVPHALMRDYGLLAIFLIVFVEQFGVPLPSILVLILAGAVAANDPLFGTGAVLLASSASIAGGMVLFTFGRRRGDALLALLCTISLSPNKCIRVGRTAYERFGPSALILARFVPGLSALAPPLAGTVGMPFRTFFAYQTAGALLFALFGLALGLVFNDRVDMLVAAVRLHARPILYISSGALMIWLAYVGFIKRNH